MHLLMQILSQYLGPQEAQLYCELQSKAKSLIKLSEETKNKLEAETGDKKLAAVILKIEGLHQEVRTDCRKAAAPLLQSNWGLHKLLYHQQQRNCLTDNCHCATGTAKVN